MLNIALCDDDLGQLKLIASYVSEFLQSHNESASIREFSHPDDLLNACSKQRFHLYVLDIVMPLINGIEVGKAIRKLDREAHIIYTTFEPGFALQSFFANPTNYLLKPIDKQQFFDTLQLIFSKLDTTQERTLSINTRQGLHVIRYSEIVFCEYLQHTVIYTLLGNKRIQTKVIKSSFAQHIEPLMHDRRFIKPHISYLVNIDHVTVFTKDRFTLLDEYTVPIAAKSYSTVRDLYMDYLLAKEHTR